MRTRSSAIALLASGLFISLCAQACGSKSNGFVFPGDNNGNDSGTSSDNDSGAYFPPDDSGTFGPIKDSGTILGDANCATATATASRTPVYMLFVLDGSGSMKDQSKWTAATAALDTIFDSFKTQADPGFGAGMIVFEDTKCGLFGCAGPYPSNQDVSIAFVDQAQHDKLIARIAPPDAPSGGTPTQAALTGGYKELEGFTATAPLAGGGKKVLVILTDGVPTDCATGPNSTCVTLAATELAKAGPQGPITTFVIGVGNFPSTDTSSFDPTFLGALAQAGGTAPAGCNPNENTNVANVCYFEVDPSTGTAAQTSQKFIDAINTIRGQVASCTFQLQVGSSGQIDPTKVNVTFTDSNGQTTDLFQDPVNGWTYDNPTNPTQVILHGTACTNVKTEVNSKVTIELGCTTRKPA